MSKFLLCIISVLLFLMPLPVRAETAETWLDVWNTGYSGEEGFTNCRLLSEAYGLEYPIETLHQWHTCTSNGLEADCGMVAVDPDFIAYGSILYYPPYADMCGRYGLAGDTGVGGWWCDWWVETNQQANSLTGYGKVRVLRDGWDRWLVDPVLWGLTE